MRSAIARADGLTAVGDHGGHCPADGRELLARPASTATAAATAAIDPGLEPYVQAMARLLFADITNHPDKE